MSEQQAFRIIGLSCSGCAAKFEKKVADLPHVEQATVNFGASKLTIVGQASIEELEAAGAFDKLSIQPHSVGPKLEVKSASFMENNWKLVLSLWFLFVGMGISLTVGGANLASTGLYIAVIGLSGWPLFKEGIKDLIKGQFTMQSLMTIAIIGAVLLGQWSEGAVVVILFAISESLERYSMDKARQSIHSLMTISPTEATIRRDYMETVIPVKDIQIGDILLIKPGQKIAMDGEVILGYSAVNQAAITGESMPVNKTIGDPVYAGTVNEEGFLEVCVTKRVEDTTLAKIIHLVEEAQGERAPAQAFVDRFARYYTPSIMVIACLVGIIPPLLLGGEWGVWLYQGLSLLVVGCPCSLVISTPVSIVSAIGNAAKQGVLIKGGIYLEEIGGLQAIAFDKTGTLTEGKPVVTDMMYHDNATDVERDTWLAYLVALEAYSQHPIALAILEEGRKHHLDDYSVVVEQFVSITGQGIQGVINGEQYLVGHRQLFETSEGEWDCKEKHCQKEGKTTLFFGTPETILAMVAVRDTVRDSSRKVMALLSDLGIQETVMLTGDNQLAGEAIGTEVGVTKVRSELMPDNKLAYVKELQVSYGKVGMVGDGINDAPALAIANVGIAMGGAGTDAALETADVVLMGDDLSKLPFLVKLSRQTLRIIKQNITFSLLIKIVALLLVIPGWLTLWIAIMADMGATLLVTLNSLRLMRIK